jgi:hypothetical protein
MTIQYINTGSSANAGNGDSLRSAFIKVNNNFSYLSTASFGGGGGGYTGSRGYTGSAGNVGYTGSQGPTGSINDLSDVTIQSPALNDYLKYVSGTWTNSQLAIVDDLTPKLSNDLDTNGHIIRSNVTGTAVTLQNSSTGIRLQGPVIIGSSNLNIDGSLYIVRNTYSTTLTTAFTYAQHHDTTDAINFNLYRSRGTSITPQAVQDGDDLADINFVGHDGTNPVGAAVITAAVDGNISTGTVPGRLSFILRGTDGIIRTHAQITSSGTWKIDKLSHLSTTTSSIVVSTNLIPSEDVIYDLGSTSSQWRSLYVSSSTIYIGGVAVSVAGGNLSINGNPVSANTGTGYTGSASTATGYTGSVGATGYTGSASTATGYTGSVGATGYTGSSGGAGSATTSTLVNGTYTVSLSTSGSLTLPNNVSINYSGGNVQYPRIIADSGKAFSVQGQGTSGSAALSWTVNPDAAGQYAAVAVTRAGGGNLATVVLQAQSDSGDVGTVKLWRFDETGVFTLPAGGVISEGGGLTGAIRLTPAGGANAYQALLIYPTAAADGDHVHLTAGGGATELYLGDDSRYVKLVNGGNVEIRATTTSSSASAAWSFGTDGAISTTDPLIINVPNGIPTGVGAIASTTGSWEQNPAANLATTGGSGTGLRVSVTHTGGYASAIAITVAGTGYLDGELITVTSGGSSASFIIAVTGTINWRFGIDGKLRFPDATVQTTAWTGTVAYSNITNVPSVSTSTLVNGTSTITLSSNGNTTFPTGLTLGAPRGVNTVNFTCAVDKEFQIETGTTSTGKLWQFGTTGNTTFPGNLQLNGGKIILNTGGNAYVESVDYGVNTTTSAVNIFGGPYQKIKLRAGFGTEAYWTFGTDGSLTFPDATVQTTAWTGTTTGTITAGSFNTDQITIVGNRISTTVTNANLELEGNGVGGIVANTVAEATTASTSRAVGYLGLPQASSNLTQTLTIAESGKHVYISTAGQTITIPAASSVPYRIGTTITFIAGPSATTVSIAITSDTMYLAGTGTTGTRTLAAYGMATAVKVSGQSSAGVWYINGTGLT